jgi:hypothetical protein
MTKAREYCDEGYICVVDIDLAKYFDTINHDPLINMLREKARDEQLMKLIRKCLKSGVMIGGIYKSDARRLHARQSTVTAVVEQRAPRKTWIRELPQEIRGTALKLLNRRIRVRMYGGVN